MGVVMYCLYFLFVDMATLCLVSILLGFMFVTYVCLLNLPFYYHGMLIKGASQLPGYAY